MKIDFDSIYKNINEMKTDDTHSVEQIKKILIDLTKIIETFNNNIIDLNSDV